MYIDLNDRKDVKEILDYAKSLAFEFWVDEKDTIKNPGYARRRPSDLSYDNAFEIINASTPAWNAHFRDMSFNDNLEDYWDFGGSNIGRHEYGFVFIWIQLTPENGIKLIRKFNLKMN